MATVGPIPKRQDQRRRRNKPEIQYTRGRRRNNMQVPGPDPDWHPLAANYYKAFVDSGQTDFFEPSDWAHLVDILDDVSHYKRRYQGRSANMRQALDSALSRLLVAEGDRRRMRIELEATDATDVDDDASIVALNKHVRKLSG